MQDTRLQANCASLKEELTVTKAATVGGKGEASPPVLSHARKGRGMIVKASIWLDALLGLALLCSQVGMATATEMAKPKKLNPYTGDPEAIQQGRTLYLQIGCSGCHGVGGGGGMGPALLDDEWKFGSDDETLFKLIKGEIAQQTMPAVFGTALSDDDLWKILAYVRSLYRGDPKQINW
jgi:cytochrome c(L)